MANLAWKAWDMILFYLRSQTKHRIDSPNLYAILEAMHDATSLEGKRLVELEQYRTELLQNQEELDINDLGAPSQVRDRSRRTLGEEVRGSAIPTFQGKMLAKLVHHQHAERILELGTSFGIGTSFLHLGCPNAAIDTIEGNISVAKIADGHLSRFANGHANVINGMFVDMLKTVDGPYDFIFIDGDHRRSATRNLLSDLRPKMAPTCMLVLHDIHWSKGMVGAWNDLQTLEWVSATLDLYHFGVVLTGLDMDPKHAISVVPRWMKPWQLGIFR
ncbi:MAG: class I SAM-dependent methyltransferase [Saprospiraceae bacterium]|nr:class I SAM-dependent methyltransferase [Saprospiraceae bacterium]